MASRKGCRDREHVKVRAGGATAGVPEGVSQRNELSWCRWAPEFTKVIKLTKLHTTKEYFIVCKNFTSTQKLGRIHFLKAINVCPHVFLVMYDDSS